MQVTGLAPRQVRKAGLALDAEHGQRGNFHSVSGS